MVGYRVNIQKTKALLYTNNEIIGTKIRKYFIYYSKKKNKVPRNKPNQGCEGPVPENYTTLKK